MTKNGLIFPYFSTSDPKNRSYKENRYAMGKAGRSTPNV